MLILSPAFFRNRTSLLLHPDEFTSRGIYGNREFRAVARRPVDDVPGQFVGIVVPVAHIDDRSGGIFFQNLVSAVFLRHGAGLVGIHFQEGDIEDLSGRIAGIVNVFVAG